MSFYDLLKEAFRSITANKLRSGLTILGIVIGIAAVISMISIGQGTKGQITQSIESLGSNTLSIIPGGARIGAMFMGRGSAQSLKEEDVEVLKKIDGVVDVVPVVQKTFQIVAPNGNNTRAGVIGASEGVFTVREISIESGSTFNEEHVRNISRVAVLGNNIAKDLFDDENPVGKTIRISGSNFKVIGVAAPKGGAMGLVFDDMIYIPITTMQRILSKSEYLTLILVKGKSKDILPQIQEEATILLAKKHKVDPQNPDFSIISQEDVLSTLNQVTNTMTIFLAAIAGISLIVGGIGIMNMMLTSVTERTKEIGLRKAIGAKKIEILKQFLIESVILTLIGGILGIVCGSLVSIAISKIANIPSQISVFSIILSLIFSSLVGIIFGYWPAKRAAELDPIVALRYE
jgi:putative ABC transport system permease protein